MAAASPIEAAADLRKVEVNWFAEGSSPPSPPPFSPHNRHKHHHHNQRIRCRYHQCNYQPRHDQHHHPTPPLTPKDDAESVYVHCSYDDFESNTHLERAPGPDESGGVRFHGVLYLPPGVHSVPNTPSHATPLRPSA